MIWYMPGREPTQLEVLKSDGWKKAQEASGTAYIFEVRARRLRTKLNRLNFVGLAVPVLVGLIAIGYGASSKALVWLIPIAVLIGGVQVVIFLWSVIAQWVNSYDRATQALVVNRSLAERYESLAKEQSASIEDVRQRLAVLDAEDKARRDEDYRESITDREKRMGMHALLFQYGRKCAACEQKPLSMIPTECGVCGDFPRGWLR
jgi:mobilome CxxCx(11)CxxC protein